MIRALEQIIEWRGKPSAGRCDNGPEYIAQLLIDWANDQQITLLYTQPGKPTQNAYIERFNRTVRHEWLELHLFESVEQAQYLATKWLWTYNNDVLTQRLAAYRPGSYWRQHKFFTNSCYLKWGCYITTINNPSY